MSPRRSCGSRWRRKLQDLAFSTVGLTGRGGEKVQFVCMFVCLFVCFCLFVLFAQFAQFAPGLSRISFSLSFSRCFSPFTVRVETRGGWEVQLLKEKKKFSFESGKIKSCTGQNPGLKNAGKLKKMGRGRGFPHLSRGEVRCYLVTFFFSFLSSKHGRRSCSTRGFF